YLQRRTVERGARLGYQRAAAANADPASAGPFDGHRCGEWRWLAQYECRRSVDVCSDSPAHVAAVAAARGSAEAGWDDQGICPAAARRLFRRGIGSHQV